MTDLIAHPEFDGILAIFLTFVAGIVVFLTVQCRRHLQVELEVALKRDMLERGMSADEIARVTSAKLGDRPVA